MSIVRLSSNATAAVERHLSHAGLTVLVADQEAGTGRRVMARLLRETGAAAEVLSVPTLADALLTVAERKIDIILLDLFLADSHGVETAITMVRGARAVPVILAVRSGQEELCFEALQYGVLAMIAKDRMTDRALLPLIRWAIERHARSQSFELRNREKALRRAEALCRPCAGILDPCTARERHAETASGATVATDRVLDFAKARAS